MEELVQFLCSIYKLSPECIAYLHKMVKSRNVKKGEVILRIGEVNRHLYFIKKGVLHCHYYVKSRSVSAWFFWETDTVVSIGSFYDQTPSEDCIEAYEDCELYYITKDEFDELCRRFHDFSLLANRLFMKYLKVFHDHARLIRKRTARERLELLLKKYPELMQRIAVKYLASWISMEKETLSRGGKRKKRKGK